MPFDDFEPGCYNIEWVFEEITYRKRVCFEVGEPFRFLWPFQSHGVFVFQIYDVNGDPVTFDIDGVGYDCFNAIGIPTYEIDEEELNELLALCDDPFGLITFEFIGRGDLEILEWVLEPPPGADDWEISHEFVGRGDLELVTLTVEDQPDHEIEVELIGRGDLDLDYLLLGDPPGFAFLLSEEDNTMQAFSFRKLRPAYSGFCCQIERWADNATLNVGFNGGWIDENAVNNFLMGTNGGIRTWYNQQGPGGNWVQEAAFLQPQIGDSGGMIKVNIGGNFYPTCVFSGVKQFNITSGSVGPWFGIKHTGHIVVRTTGDSSPKHFEEAAGAAYAGLAQAIGSTHFAGAGTPTYWANLALQFNTTSSAYRTYVLNNDMHVWMNDLDLSAWSETTFGFGFQSYLFEWVIWNEDLATQRLLRTNQTMAVYNL